MDNIFFIETELDKIQTAIAFGGDDCNYNKLIKDVKKIKKEINKLLKQTEQENDKKRLIIMRGRAEMYEGALSRIKKFNQMKKQQAEEEKE